METLQFMKDNKDNNINAKNKSALLNTTISFTPKSSCKNSNLSAREKNKSSFSHNRRSYGARTSFQYDQFNPIPILQGESILTPK